MSCCAGLFKKRGKSLPPNGTKAGDRNLNQKFNKEKQKSYNDVTGIIPTQEIDILADEQPSMIQKYVDQTDSNRSSKYNEINAAMIIPAPLSFQEHNESKTTDGFESSESSEIKLETNKEDEYEFLNSLNKNLDSQLSFNNYSKHTPRDEPKSLIKSIKSQQQSQFNNKSKSQSQKFYQQEEDDEQEEKSILNTLINNNKQTKSQVNSGTKNERSLNSTANSLASLNQSIQNKSIMQFNNNNFINKEFESNQSSFNIINNETNFSNNTIQKLIESFNIDKNLLENLKIDNKNLRLIIGDFQKQSTEREMKNKEENDFMIERVQELLAKDMRTEQEKEALKKYFLSKQQEINENLIKEQTRFIETLQSKCKKYEDDFKKMGNVDFEISQIEVKELKEETNALRDIVHRLNVELSIYQAKYPSPNALSSAKSELSGLSLQGPAPIWLVNTKFLSPLIAVYDERIHEKEDKLKLLKNKIDDLTNKFKMILDENNELHIKLSRKPFDFSAANVNDLNEINQIRHHAQLVLEENQILKDQVDLHQKKLLDIQKIQIKEVGQISKKIIISETDKTDLKNQIEILKSNYEDLLHKHNDAIAESQRRIPLKDHLNQTGELKRKIDENNFLNKQEVENLTIVLENLQTEKNEFALKNRNLTSENKKLIAENKVLDKALNEGIGRKMQKKLQDLEKRLQLSEIKEKTAMACLEKLAKDLEKIELEKEAYQNLAKTNEIEIKKNENKLAEENLKISKLEDKLKEYKEKSTNKLSSVLQKLKHKDSEFSLVKMENDKKVADVLNLLQKKQDQIDDLIKEKRIIESELEFVWQTTSAENRKIKESLLDLKLKPIYTNSSAHHKLLLEDD